MKGPPRDLPRIVTRSDATGDLVTRREMAEPPSWAATPTTRDSTSTPLASETPLRTHE